MNHFMIHIVIRLNHYHLKAHLCRCLCLLVIKIYCILVGNAKRNPQDCIKINEFNYIYCLQKILKKRFILIFIYFRRVDLAEWYDLRSLTMRYMRSTLQGSENFNLIKLIKFKFLVVPT